MQNLSQIDIKQNQNLLLQKNEQKDHNFFALAPEITMKKNLKRQIDKIQEQNQYFNLKCQLINEKYSQSSLISYTPTNKAKQILKTISSEDEIISVQRNQTHINIFQNIFCQQEQQVQNQQASDCCQQIEEESKEKTEISQDQNDDTIFQTYNLNTINPQQRKQGLDRDFCFNEEVFNNINQNKFKNNIFEQQKSNIFKKLEEQKINLGQIIMSDKKGDLFYSTLQHSQFKNEKLIVKAIYNATSQQIQLNLQLTEYLKLYNFCLVIEPSKTILLGVYILNCYQILNKLDEFVKDTHQLLNFNQIENNLEITYKNNKIWESQTQTKLAKNQLDLLISLSQIQNILICQYEDNEISGLLNQQLGDLQMALEYDQNVVLVMARMKSNKLQN
ncbi:hypothetical protein ABPG74_006808 [Tetrahymena malaccensis]